MGLFSFLRGKGKKLGDAKAADMPARADFEQELAELGLDTQGLDIEVEPTSHKVRLKGAAKDQETKEKVILAVGNVEGVAEVEDETPGDAPRLHTVEAGDTLWAIAEKTLGDGARFQEIFEANRPMLADPDRIYPGQVLRLPPA